MARGRRIWSGLAVVIAGAFVALTVGLPLLHRHYAAMRSTTPSQGRLHMLGIAILLYQRDHADAYPDTLVELARRQGRPADRYAFCPLDEDDGPGDPRWAYVYLGRGMTANVDATTAVAYEPLAFNDGLGSSVLFGDGHTEWVDAAQMPATLAAGRPATRPSSGPAAAGILRP